MVIEAAVHRTMAPLLIVMPTRRGLQRAKPVGEVERASELRLADHLLLEGSVRAHVHAERIIALVPIGSCGCSVREATCTTAPARKINGT